MKQYSKHILQYGQRGHLASEEIQCAYMFTQRKGRTQRKRIIEISTLLLFPTWFSFHSRCSNTYTLFGNKNGEFCKPICATGGFKLKSYESMNI